jgi:hypothetical protein
MKSLIDRRFVFAVLTVACLMTVLLTVAPIRSGSPGAGEYDAWLDWNDDGKIDMKDISRAAKAFGTNGQNISKARIEYDSGWINITSMAGQNITITHGLNLSDWNSEDIDASITGKVSIGGELQRYLGLTQSGEWNHTYGGPGDDTPFALVQTVDSGYALAGETDSFGAGGGDFWLVKTDADGKMQWNKTYGGTNPDSAYALVQTSDGGYALAGYTSSYGAGVDFWLVKTDASGNSQWNQTYGGTGYDGAYALVQTNDGGYVLAGLTESFGAGYEDFWLVRTDSSGNMQWNRTYGGIYDDRAYALVQTNDGGYALAGATGPLGGDGNRDFWLVKTDASGTLMWNQTYGGTSWDEVRALVQTNDGGYALAGFAGGVHIFWLVKTDASGTMQWNQTYEGGREAYALVQTSDGGYAVAGMTNYQDPFGLWTVGPWLIKTDADGHAQWHRLYEATGLRSANALVQTVDGGCTLAGGDRDFWLIKTGVESGLAWVDSSANTITLYRGATDTSWNYVRVRLWKPR